MGVGFDRQAEELEIKRSLGRGALTCRAMGIEAERIAQLADELKIGFCGLSLAILPLADPRQPLMAIYRDLYEQTADSPLVIYRNDGTPHSAERLTDIFAKSSSTAGAGLGEDLLNFATMHGAARLGDAIQRAGLSDRTSPLLQFVRHFRNACAHGNRWHFQNAEPRQPAELRGIVLTSALHGSKAAGGTVGAGDYLDMLDDVAAHFRA
ncbi:predicted protein [Streptomyces viridochromogenes DSM 40736]|uniref:Predicted protein n=2 Tax=Streptomyces viridochromogenes TaxID=1938 RepID=D9X9J9_STRVT|nr:predicted protein [Streptomyces viridochromogenes DSM 40736]